MPWPSAWNRIVVRMTPWLPLLSSLALLAACAPLSAQESESQPRAEYVLDPALVDRIVQEGTERSQVMEFQDHLCHELGSRLTGSLAFDRAADWAVEQFAAMGLDARLEPWGEWRVGWDREQWMGRVVEPEGLELQVACPAWTGSTRGIARGTLVAVPTDDEQLSALRARCEQTSELWLFGALPLGEDMTSLRDGILELLTEGKVLGLCQSATSTRWNDARFPNQIRVFGDRTAGLKPFESRQRWPQAVILDDQSEQIQTMLEAGQQVVIEFELRNRWRRGPVTLNNVVADLVGTEFPDEIVIVCAHLDSWHQATGATDNGTGTCSTLETARILTAAGFKPRRTLRFILWGGEEQGLLGSRQYVVRHRSEMHRISAVFNHDSGTNWAHRLTVAASQHDDFARIIQPLLDHLRPPEAGYTDRVFGANRVDVLRPAGGGSDHASFGAVGVPAFSWHLRGEVPYARGWHSQWDTYSIVVPHYQRHNATTFAVVSAGTANLDHMLSRKGVERAKPDQRGRVSAQLIVETQLGVELDGMKVTKVSLDGSGQRAGLQAGDVVKALGGVEMKTIQDLHAALRDALAQESKAVLTVEPGARTIEIRQ
jgi:carboxypeptidase Q